LAYRLENAIAANSYVRFYLLMAVFVVGVVSSAVAWTLLYRVQKKTKLFPRNRDASFSARTDKILLFPTNKFASSICVHSFSARVFE
jgi:hypothetical protein